MTEKYQNKYRILSGRLSNWDYSSSGEYFITACTAARKHYFGEVVNDEMQLSPIGEKARECWLDIPNHFQFVSLDAFTVMPNHAHGIIIIDKPPGYRTGVDHSTVVETGHALSLQSETETSFQCLRFRNQGKNTISAMVGSFKSAVTKWCNENNLPFAWQVRFHDHIIRDRDEFYRIRNYIIHNPANWKDDDLFTH